MTRVTFGFANGMTLAITVKSFRRDGPRYTWEHADGYTLADIDINSIIWVVKQPAKTVLEPVWGRI